MYITQRDMDREILHITDWIQNRFQDLEASGVGQSMLIIAADVNL